MLPFISKLALQKSAPKKRVQFSIAKGTAAVAAADVVPEEWVEIRLISPAGGFSSACVVAAIAKRRKIDAIHISTLRVGKKEMQALAALHIPEVYITCGGIALENAVKYDYAQQLSACAKRFGWKVRYCRNHSKVILIRSGEDKIVVETSSNYNENPQIEQFCISNNKEVYDFYLAEMQALGIWE